VTAPSSQPSESREQSELTRQLRDEIDSRGSVVSTISDLLARLDEPNPTIEARVRAGRVLAEGGIQTKPALTAMFVKPGSTVRLMLGPVQRSLRVAKVHKHPGGGGTLLTEPVLVFYGKHRQDLRVLDQDSKQLGVARWFRDKAARLEGYEIYGADDEVPLVALNWRIPGWFGRGEYRVSNSEGIEIATLSARETGYTARYGPIMVGAKRIGYLKPATGRKPAYVEDNEGREVARILGSTSCYVTEIEPSLAGPLRAIAVVANIILGNAKSSNWGDGGA